jgi:hypothetical protein
MRLNIRTFLAQTTLGVHIFDGNMAEQVQMITDMCETIPRRSDREHATHP